FVLFWVGQDHKTPTALWVLTTSRRGCPLGVNTVGQPVQTVAGAQEPPSEDAEPSLAETPLGGCAWAPRSATSADVEQGGRLEDGGGNG
ncbi:MAG: hypothetical protein AAGN66_28645, partial [Acidobacteriota bacterium]